MLFVIVRYHFLLSSLSTHTCVIRLKAVILYKPQIFQVRPENTNYISETILYFHFVRLEEGIRTTGRFRLESAWLDQHHILSKHFHSCLLSRVTLHKGENELLRVFGTIFDKYQRNLIFDIFVTRMLGLRCLDFINFNSF
jgi:hypothetical protein